MFTKIQVADRGEIAVRAFRAAYELHANTVAVFPFEDRNSAHRLKADESYQIGELGHPVRAYLSVDEIIEAAKRSGAEAIYPGYGFLSENPDLAAACTAAGITFVGPSSEVLELTGNALQQASARCEIISPNSVATCVEACTAEAVAVNDAVQASHWKELSEEGPWPKAQTFIDLRSEITTATRSWNHPEQ